MGVEKGGGGRWREGVGANKNTRTNENTILTSTALRWGPFTPFSLLFTNSTPLSLNLFLPPPILPAHRHSAFEHFNAAAMDPRLPYHVLWEHAVGAIFLRTEHASPMPLDKVRRGRTLTLFYAHSVFIFNFSVQYSVFIIQCSDSHL